MGGNNKVIVGVVITLLAISVVGTATLVLRSNAARHTPISVKNPDAVILKVGDESIFQKDLDYELSLSPQPLRQNPETIKNLVDKLVNDSVVLQQGHKEGMVELGNLSYNSSTKDYAIRVKELNRIKQTIDARTERIEGTIISIWFYNSIIPRMGIAKARDTVRSKIQTIQADVKNKSITIEQAINRIKEDSSLEEVDGAYKSNAGYKFNATRADRITIDGTFDELLWQLKEGEITDIYELKGLNKKTGITEPVLYSFGAMEKRANTGTASDYNAWLKESLNKYEITRF